VDATGGRASFVGAFHAGSDAGSVETRPVVIAIIAAVTTKKVTVMLFLVLLLAATVCARVVMILLLGWMSAFTHRGSNAQIITTFASIVN
jgi:hypothetical protein